MVTPVHNGTHALDLVTWLIGRRPIRVFARSFPTFAAGMPVHDSFHLTVRFEDGSLALIELAYALPQSGKMVRRIVVSGDFRHARARHRRRPGTDDGHDQRAAVVDRRTRCRIRCVTGSPLSTVPRAR